MTGLFPRAVTTVWCVLLLLTVSNTWLGLSQLQSSAVPLVLALLAGLKIFLILQHFMDLRTAPRAWQALLGLWLALATATMAAGQFVG